jgi:hypothetical protein
MIEIDLQEPPAIIELRDDAKAIARLRLYGDDCVLMGWTGDYKSVAPVAAFLAKAEALNVPQARAVTVLLEQTDDESARWRLEYLQQDSTKLAEFLSVTCPALALRFPEVLVADGDEPTTPEQFNTRLLNFTIRLS